MEIYNRLREILWKVRSPGGSPEDLPEGEHRGAKGPWKEFLRSNDQSVINHFLKIRPAKAGLTPMFFP